MAAPWTVEQVNGMAPDTASIAAGRKLASAAKWQRLGQTDRLIWGEIRGSGSTPYQTCIDTAGPAFKCSCPSRKFPCKHSLGLALAHAESTSAFATDAPPQWVAEWLDKREARSEREARGKTKTAEPVDPATAQRRAAAQAKRRDQREEKMQAGLDELQRWLADTLRQGLARAMEQQSWDHMAARLVDAQIPGLARWLRRCQEARYGSEQWQGTALQALSRLQLILDACQRRETLPEPVRADLDELLGIPLAKETVLTQPGVADIWRVMGKWTSDADRLQVQRTWLRGERTQRWALLLDFAVAGAVLPIMPPEGVGIEGELAFYPATWPVRALLKTQRGTEPAQPNAMIAAGDGLDGLYRTYAERLAATPWLERIPAALRDLTPVKVDEHWLLIDAAHRQIPLAPHFPLRWELLAMGGGAPVQLFGEWDGEAFFPLTIADGSRLQGFHALHMELS
ncbi:hypothetical protein EDC29_108111 [Marichromatium gracile]|uniref:SWIM-type domain-containing protein n=2 Tax=Marichromatium gracile TaxID=1048 RepID=A0A4R4A7X2_MARGR|nr:hypothetical protein [Marichromatium gracile]TCW34947.1 hypothetical protein EDC29_108111 [Marichromatium gracile]